LVSKWPNDMDFFYDGLIVAAAVRAGYAILYTEDLRR
jgi:predicted nucleic acid-binding protein